MFSTKQAKNILTNYPDLLLYIHTFSQQYTLYVNYYKTLHLVYFVHLHVHIYWNKALANIETITNNFEIIIIRKGSQAWLEQIQKAGPRPETE